MIFIHLCSVSQKNRFIPVPTAIHQLCRRVQNIEIEAAAAAELPKDKKAAEVAEAALEAAAEVGAAASVNKGPLSDEKLAAVLGTSVEKVLALISLTTVASVPNEEVFDQCPLLPFCFFPFSFFSGGYC